MNKKKERDATIVKIFKILSSQALMAFRTTPCRIVRHPTAVSDGRVRQITPRRWNSMNDWPAGLQFMPIKMQNYDAHPAVSRDKWHSWGFAQPGLNQYAQGRIPSFFGLISLNYNGTRRRDRLSACKMIAAYNKTGNYNYYLYIRVCKYFNTFSTLCECYKKFPTFCPRSFTGTDEGDRREILKIINCWGNDWNRYSWIDKFVNVRILQ